MTQKQFIMNEVAKIVGVKAHVIAYAISSQTLPEPKLRIAGKRVFSAKEVENIKTYFENRNKKENHDK